MAWRGRAYCLLTMSDCVWPDGETADTIVFSTLLALNFSKNSICFFHKFVCLHCGSLTPDCADGLVYWGNPWVEVHTVIPPYTVDPSLCNAFRGNWMQIYSAAEGLKPRNSQIRGKAGNAALCFLSHTRAHTHKDIHTLLLFHDLSRFSFCVNHCRN